MIKNDDSIKNNAANHHTAYGECTFRPIQSYIFLTIFITTPLPSERRVCLNTPRSQSYAKLTSAANILLPDQALCVLEQVYHDFEQLPYHLQVFENHT